MRDSRAIPFKHRERAMLLHGAFMPVPVSEK
jgi:hypothetical protein